MWLCYRQMLLLHSLKLPKHSIWFQVWICCGLSLKVGKMLYQLQEDCGFFLSLLERQQQIKSHKFWPIQKLSTQKAINPSGNPVWVKSYAAVHYWPVKHVQPWCIQFHRSVSWSTSNEWHAMSKKDASVLTRKPCCLRNTDFLLWTAEQTNKTHQGNKAQLLLLSLDSTNTVSIQTAESSYEP